MGTTLKMVPQHAKVKRFNKIEFIPLVGGIGEADMTTHSNQLVVELSKGMGGKFKLLHGPAIVSNENIINILRQDKNINAQGKWMQSYIDGDNEGFVVNAYKENLKKFSKGLIK